VWGIEKGAAYLPVGMVAGHRTAGPDEDCFTLGATALERLLDPGTSLPTNVRLHLAGDFPQGAEVDLLRFLGSPIPTERFGAGEDGLFAAMDSALQRARGGSAVLVVAADLAADRTHREIPATIAHSDAAVALWVAESDRAVPPPAREAPEGDRGWATAPLFRLVARPGEIPPAGWVGDWKTGPRRDRTGATGALTRRSTPSGGPVSQGAYVPRPRYLENLPSRWWFAAERCGICRVVTFPIRGRCRGCERQDALETVRLPRDGGTVIAATTIGPGGQPTEFDEQVAATGPYSVVLVEIAKGVRVTLQVTDAAPGEVGIGARVATRLRRLYLMEGEWRYGRKAVPLDE
jgi:uncharacterized OB-fold protein